MTSSHSELLPDDVCGEDEHVVAGADGDEIVAGIPRDVEAFLVEVDVVRIERILAERLRLLGLVGI